jgi:uncharacterized membrane protein
MGPMGILLGPAMCGIYMCLFSQEAGETPSFNVLFQGFNYFSQSLIATLLMVAPMMVMLLLMYALFCGGVVGVFALFRNQAGVEGEPGPAPTFAIIALSVVSSLVFTAIGMVFQALFLFTYPLIVDKGLSGFDAVKVSFRGVLANFGGVLGLVLLTQLMSMLGVLVCFVGVYLELPLHFAMTVIAYRQIFPRDQRLTSIPAEEDDEPLALSGRSSDTSVKAESPD